MQLSHGHTLIKPRRRPDPASKKSAANHVSPLHVSILLLFSVRKGFTAGRYKAREENVVSGHDWTCVSGTCSECCAAQTSPILVSFAPLDFGEHRGGGVSQQWASVWGHHVFAVSSAFDENCRLTRNGEGETQHEGALMSWHGETDATRGI